MLAIEQSFSAMERKRKKVADDDSPQYLRAGAKLKAELKRRELGPVEFGRMLDAQEGYKSGYQNVRNWKKGRGFQPSSQRACARALGLPPTFFDDEDTAEVAEEAAEAVRHPALATLLKERQLRQYTITALLALDKANDYPDERAWRDLADLHEGIAAQAEVRSRLSLVHSNESPGDKRKR